MGDVDMSEATNQCKIEGIIGFIGCGNMAKAIAFPLFRKGVLNPENVIVSATSDRNLKDWKELGCMTSTNNVDVIAKAETILWSTKPQIFPGAVNALVESLPEIQGTLQAKSIIHISIMAGILLETFREKIENLLDKYPIHSTCFRVMPNIGLKVDAGVAVFTGPSDASEQERNLVQSFFKPTGLTYEVPENLMDAYASLFGSGIGFMFPIIEALSDGGVKMGIPRHISLELAAQTMKGAGELVLQEKLHPGALKDAVCSPGGTTICGIAAMEAGGVRSAMINAVEAATVRAQMFREKK